VAFFPMPMGDRYRSGRTSHFIESYMPLKIQYQPNDVCVLRISGILKQSEFGAEQSALSRRIETGAKPRLLVILENFDGWERGADWNDLDFLLSYSHKIMKIAIVAERRWEILALAFAGAGFRLGPVKFFAPNELEEAQSWLVE
jgi:SpoIIAA-like